MLKIKFLALTHPINLHHRDDIYYMVLVTILLHNMMVEEHVKNDEVEESSFYNTICGDSNDDNSNEEDGDDDGCDKSPVDRHDKFKVVHRRWEELYEYKGSKELKDSIQRHLCMEKCGKDALRNDHLWMDNYTLLTI